MEAKGCAHTAHYGICPIYAFPQELGVCGITHVALVACGVSVHRVQVFHVWFPHVGQYLLLFLHPELACKFGYDAVYKLVVLQGVERVYHHAAEQLVVDVAVQMLQQLGSTQLRVHLQKHKSNLAFRTEVRLWAAMNSTDRFHKTETQGHLMQREYDSNAA